MLLCVFAIDGGGLNASADISLWFSSVQQQLSVQPAAINVTHYSPGLSRTAVNVAYDPGSLPTGSWTAIMPASKWVIVAPEDQHTLSVSFNSTSLAFGSQSVFTAAVTLSTLGMI